MQDAATLPEASYQDHPENHILQGYCGHCSHDVNPVCQHCGSFLEPLEEPITTSEQLAGQYRRFHEFLIASTNPRLAMDAYYLAAGFAIAEGLDLAFYANKWGMSRERIEAECKMVAEHFGMKPPC